MSTLLYGYASRGPTTAQNPFLGPTVSGTSQEQDQASRTKQFVEMVAGLVPSEVLAIQLFVLQLLSDDDSSAEEAVATVESVGWLQGSFVALVVLALGFYVAGVDPRTVSRPYLFHHLFRCLVVVAAFSVWNWLQPVSAWNTWIDLDGDAWLIVGAIAAGAVFVLNLIVIKFLPLPPPPPSQPPPTSPPPAP